MRFNLVALFFILSVHLSSCKQEPKPINYGVDACHFCRMTIVDKIHGAEMVTDKGKVFKFDAAECLFRYMNELEGSEGFLFLTNHFESPEQLFSMKDAIYLESENLPSPMGAFLTAFSTKEMAEKLQQDKGGELFTYTDMIVKFKD